MRRVFLPMLALCAALTPAHAEIMVANAMIKLGIGARPAAMHGTIMNHGDATALIGAESPAFHHIELHTHQTDNKGMMRMMQVPRYELAPHGTVKLAPGGDHLMLFGFRGKAGETVEVTLKFANGAAKTVTVPTKARAKHKSQAGDASHHGDHGH